MAYPPATAPLAASSTNFATERLAVIAQAFYPSDFGLTPEEIATLWLSDSPKSRSDSFLAMTGGDKMADRVEMAGWLSTGNLVIAGKPYSVSEDTANAFFDEMLGEDSEDSGRITAEEFEVGLQVVLTAKEYF